MERWLILVWSFLFALLGEAQVRVSAWPEGKDGLERSPDYDVTVKISCRRKRGMDTGT